MVMLTVRALQGQKWDHALDEVIEAGTQKVGVKSKRKLRSAVNYKCAI